MRRCTSLLAVSIAAALAAISACKKKPSGAAKSGEEKEAAGAGEAKTAEPKAEGTAQPAGESGQQVEVFSWWTGAGEQEGLDAMIADFKSKNAGIEFINAAVSGGAGTNAKAILANRLQANNPPDSYQRHAGLELADD